MALLNEQAQPSEPILSGTIARRVNFEIPEPLEKPDGTINLAALAQAVVTQFRGHVNLTASGEVLRNDFDATPYNVALADFLDGVAARLGMSQVQALAVFVAIIEELDALYEAATAPPAPASEG